MGVVEKKPKAVSKKQENKKENDKASSITEKKEVDITVENVANIESKIPVSSPKKAITKKTDSKTPVSSPKKAITKKIDSKNTSKKKKKKKEIKKTPKKKKKKKK